MQFLWMPLMTFMQLLERHKKCVAFKGDAFEGKFNDCLIISCVSFFVDQSREELCFLTTYVAYHSTIVRYLLSMVV